MNRAGQWLRRHPEAWLGALAALPLLAVAARGRMFFLLDVLAEHYPNQRMINAVLAESPRAVPLWNPYMFCGTPLLADPQMEICYPPAILFRLAPYPVAYGTFLALHFALAVLGTWSFLRGQRAAPAAAALGAGAYGWSGQMFISAVTPVCLAAMAWLPWIAWAAARVSRRPDRHTAAALGLVLACLVLAGHPQFVVYAGCVLVAVWIAEGAPGRAAGWLGGAALLAFALAALQVLPSLAYLPDTGRAAPLAGAEAGVDSLQWQHLLGYLRPLSDRVRPNPDVLDIRHLWPTFNFIGTIPLALAFAGAWLGRKTRSGRTALLLAALATAMALGEHLPGLGGWLGALPSPGWFRRSAYWMCVTNLGLVWLAALAAERLAAARGRWGRVARLAPWIAGATWIQLLGVGLLLQPSIPAEWLMRPPAGERWLEARVGPAQRWGRVADGAARLRQGVVEGGSLEDAVQHVRAALRPNLPAAAGLRQVDGVNPLFPARVLRARATLEQGDRSARAALLNRLGAAYVISQDATIEPGSPAFAAGPFIHHRAGAILPVRFAGAGEGEIEGVSSAPGRWNFRTTVRQPVSVVIAESWLAGWQASVDGRPARGTRPDDDGLITVALEPGRHAVELVYVSSAARIGLLISLLALAVALGAAWPVSRFGGR